MINKKEFKKICDLIYRRSGISIDEKKFDSLADKINKVISDNNFNNFRSFFHTIRFGKDDKLFQQLINVVSINETYFFRENYQFESLLDYVLPKLDELKPKNKPIRILSAPCSTGEEAYSLGLHLLREGKLVNQRDFEIIGIDIDSNVIEKAEEGVFSNRSIKFLPQEILKKYFVEIGDKYKIVDFLREVITFKKVNVMDKKAMKRLGKFDVILSRNMLIYFDDVSRREVAMTFYEMLESNGYLFLGHAESMNRIVSVFKTEKIGESIAYKRD